MAFVFEYVFVRSAKELCDCLNVYLKSLIKHAKSERKVRIVVFIFFVSISARDIITLSNLPTNPTSHQNMLSDTSTTRKPNLLGSKNYICTAFS